MGFGELEHLAFSSGGYNETEVQHGEAYASSGDDLEGPMLVVFLDHFAQSAFSCPENKDVGLRLWRIRDESESLVRSGNTSSTANLPRCQPVLGLISFCL
nr:hypothetical protein Iba_chr02aCG17900 [Ipomoea batatas]